MAELIWNQPSDKTFEAGVDRGVLYLESGKAIPWSGLTSVEDGGTSDTKNFYLDGQKYLSIVSARDWEGTIEAYTYPDEFGELLGIEEVGDGLFLDSQMPGRFNLSYRTMVSAPAFETRAHYKMHLIYSAMASLGEFTYNSLGDGAADPVTFKFEISAIPQVIAGHRPTAHVIIDTRTLDDTTRAALESLVYGDRFQNASFPTLSQLVDLLHFGEDVVVVDNHDGTWTATGSSKNVRVSTDDHFQIDSVDAVYVSQTTYLFRGAIDKPIPALGLEDDGAPFFTTNVGPSNVGEDSESAYYEEGAFDASVLEDDDGVPYLEG